MMLGSGAIESESFHDMTSRTFPMMAGSNCASLWSNHDAEVPMIGAAM